MKLKLKSLIVILVLPLCLYGQSSNVDSLYRAVGMDANFINNFLPIDNNIGSRGKYLLHYIKYKSNGKFTRHAVDLNLFGSFEKNESELDKDDAQFAIDYKISKGTRKNIFRNESGYFLYGGEVAIGYFFNRRSNIDFDDPLEESINRNIEHLYSAAIGPFVGFGYKFFKRFSIYTETGVSLRFSYAIDKFTSELDPTTDFTDKKTTIRTQYVLPSSIILFYHF